MYVTHTYIHVCACACVCTHTHTHMYRCSLGGLEPAEQVDAQVFGNNLARYAIYAIGNSSATLQACVLENTVLN